MNESNHNTHPTEPRWTHIALRVSNMDATVEWYLTYTPLELIDRREDEMGYGAWLGMPDKTNNPFILVIAQFYPDKDPFANAPIATLAPFAHLGMELPTKEDVEAIAERAKIKTFFNFEVDVDFESKRIYPLPDVDSFIEILHRTSMSVLWVAANFRPVMKVSSRA